MPTKDAYQERVQAEIATIYAALDHHDRHLESTEAVSKESHDAALRELKRQHSHLDDLLKELEQAGEHAWHHLRERIDLALEDLRAGIQHTRERLRRDK